MTFQDLERKLKEKETEIVRLIDEEESLRDDMRELENNLMQIEDVLSVRELRPVKYKKQGTI